MSWSRYSAYRPTEVEWMPEIPKHWAEERAKFIFKREQRLPRSEDEIVTAFRDGEVVMRRERRTDGFTQSIKEIGYQGVRIGDLVIHAMDAFAGAIGVSKSDGKCTPVYSICTPQSGKSGQPAYYAYLLRDMAQREFILALARGIRERSTEFRFGDFKELTLPMPRPDEQIKVAAFLNRETSKLDALIQKKQRLIELLNEKRAALISHAVTKGLDPSVAMRPSGVEWIGEIPAHWTTTRLKFETSHIVDCLHSTPQYKDDGYPAIRTADISPGHLDVINARRVDPRQYKERTQRLEPKPGDILYSREGGRYGIAAQVPEDVKICLSQRTMQFRTKNGVGSAFVMWTLNSKQVYYQASLDAYGSASPHVNVETIRNFRFAAPPPGEQRRVSGHIDRAAGEIDAAIHKIQAACRCLAEYRAALISAAVTGQIDVRDEV